MCRSPKLWIAIGAVAIGLAVAGPGLGAIAPFLLLAACPLMMLVMMGGMAGMARGRRDHDHQPDDPGEVTRLRAEVAELRQRVTQ